jgi:hypothetical protein
MNAIYKVLNALPFTGSVVSDFVGVFLAVCAGIALAMLLDKRWGWWVAGAAVVWGLALLRLMGEV